MAGSEGGGREGAEDSRLKLGQITGVEGSRANNAALLIHDAGAVTAPLQLHQGMRQTLGKANDPIGTLQSVDSRRLWELLEKGIQRLGGGLADLPETGLILKVQGCLALSNVKVRHSCDLHLNGW